MINQIAKFQGFWWTLVQFCPIPQRMTPYPKINTYHLAVLLLKIMKSFAKNLPYWIFRPFWILRWIFFYKKRTEFQFEIILKKLINLHVLKDKNVLMSILNLGVILSFRAFTIKSLKNSKRKVDINIKKIFRESQKIRHFEKIKKKYL
jgi:hypothetical protein